MTRVLVVGSSCSGKSTFAAGLSEVLSIPHIELDALHHLEDWVPRPIDEFRQLTDAATDGSDWIVDGNYSGLRETVWPKATHLIWLNYSFPLVLYRGLKRTIKRVVTQEELYSGNRESFRQSFLSSDSVLLYMITHFGHRRRQYRRVFDGDGPWNMIMVELRSPKAARAFLAEAARGLGAGFAPGNFPPNGS
ncbi:MAG: adenylate kinase family enzyme [Rhodothermales bacterium]|jgi:adenylate kinase family enzyme